MSSTQPWISEFTDRGGHLPGSQAPWLAALRRRAIERFADEGWPTPKQEAWRHTSLAVLEQQAFNPPAQAQIDAGELVRTVRRGDAGHWMVFVDGRHAPELSELGGLPAGAQLLPISDALAGGHEALESLFGSETDGASTAALNLALASDGAYVKLARGVVLDAPIHLLFITAGNGTANFTRNVVQAEAGSQATIIEHFVGQGSGASLSSSTTRIQQSNDARITHVKLQMEDEQAFHLGDLDVEQAKGSVFNSHSMSFGARLARHDIVTNFTGDHCEALLNGLYYVNGRRHVDHHTQINHLHPHGVSHEYYRGVLDDTSRGVFSGRILVAPGADKTDAIQRSDSLLLSRLAKADARPELEIYADDVKCAHGATVGQIDENSLFYLRSRGLDEAYARHVLTYAFAAQAISRLEDPALRARVETAIRALVPGGAELGDIA